MRAIGARRTARRVGGIVRWMGMLAPLLGALTGFTVAPTGGGILFAADSNVPLMVQAFAWRVIETQCNFQRHEREQRSFWAYDARTSRTDGTVAYSIKILSELTWKKTEPPAVVEMALVDDGRRLRLVSLNSSFVTCASSTTVPSARHVGARGAPAS